MLTHIVKDFKVTYVYADAQVMDGYSIKSLLRLLNAYYFIGEKPKEQI